MRMRKKTLADYGISQAEGEELYKRCKDPTEKDREAIITAALESCDPVLAVLVVDSLTGDKSYDALSAEGYIPVGRDDFYGYRRKTLARFKKLIDIDREKDKE